MAKEAATQAKEKHYEVRTDLSREGVVEITTELRHRLMVIFGSRVLWRGKMVLLFEEIMGLCITVNSQRTNRQSLRDYRLPPPG